MAARWPGYSPSRGLWVLIAMAAWIAIQIVRALVYLALGLLVSGCAGAFQVAPVVTHALDRGVFYEAPDCVAIHSSPESNAVLTQIVEPVLQRHLTTRFAKVMNSEQVWNFTGENGLVLDNPEDWRRFGEAAECNAVLRWAAPEATNEFAVVWARQRLVLQIELIRTENGRRLWVAEGVTERNDGGLPFTPVGAVIGVVRASNMQADDQVLPSMVYDVLRQAFATLPPMGPATIPD